MSGIQPYITWIEVRFAESLAAARATPPDILLVVIAGLGLFVVLIALAWRRSARRAFSATRKLVEPETEFDAVRATLDAKVRWRTAAEKVGAQTKRRQRNKTRGQRLDDSNSGVRLRKATR